MDVNLAPLTPVVGQVSNPGSPARIRDAAEQFEALLISQLLRSARVGSEEKGHAATEFAEQQMARCIAHNGGLGLAGLIARGLERLS